MLSVNCWLRCLCLICILAIGCNSKPSSTAKSDGDAASASKTDKTKKTIIPVRRDLKELTGNWVFVFTTQGKDNYRWIIKFTQGDGGKTIGEFVDTQQDKNDPNKPEIAETEVSGDAVRLVFKSGPGTFDFVGSFQDGIVRGTTRFGPNELLLSRLLSTQESSLESFQLSGLPPAADVFESALKSKDFKPAEFLITLRELKTSPLAQDVYGLLLSKSVEAKFDEAKVKELIDDYLSAAKIWGDRWVARTELSVGMQLVTGRQFPNLAIVHLDAADQKLGEDKDALKAQISAYRETASVQIRVREILDPASTDDVKTVASAELTELLKSQRYNAEILFALGVHAEKTGQIDAAIEYLSDVVAIPLLEVTMMQLRAGEPPNPPNEILKKLWTQKHGHQDGYEEHIAKVYSQRIAELIAEIQKKAPAAPASEAGNRTVLVELFTGMQCAPCVAADIALDAISKSFSQNKVIVIRYHQHIPNPDGLANQDSEERATFYEINSTPTTIIDGMKIDSRFYAGPIQAASTAFNVFRQVVDMRLKEATQAAIKLSAVVNNGQLEVTAEVTGVPEDILPACRLRLAIVENHVQAYLPLATNGIRDQEFLVRELLGGAKGISPKNGELKYSSTMPITDLQQHLSNYISQYEAGRRFQFPPELKPPVRGPLSVVAWIQNGTPEKNVSARYVLQSVIVPISGETGFVQDAAQVTSSTKQPDGTQQAGEAVKATSTHADSNQSSQDDTSQTPPAPAVPE